MLDRKPSSLKKYPYRPRLSDSGNEGVARLALVAHQSRIFTSGKSSPSFERCASPVAASALSLLPFINNTANPRRPGNNCWRKPEPSGSLLPR